MDEREIWAGFEAEALRPYGPVAFWFLNDAPKAAELRRQLASFKSHGVCGVVLHPRIGLPAAMPYLSEAFFDMMAVCIEAAAELGLKVILYDEGMYPSGSAGGLVVQSNPAFAARMLVARRQPQAGLAPGEKLVATLWCRFAPGGRLLNAAGEYDGGSEAVHLVSTLSGGTIRGIHYGEDSGNPGAPPAASVLDPAAVACFIRLTHEAYYRRFQQYFGTTVTGFFTDEPSPLGRYPRAGGVPWDDSFPEKLAAAGRGAGQLAHLFYESALSHETSRFYSRFLAGQLAESFYKPLQRWCHNHGVQLMGHPAESDDTLPARHMDVPGQDLVFRYIAPENGGLDDHHSAMAKVSADMALHGGKPRSLMEALGCCYRGENTWDLPFDDAKWMLDHLLSRGCSMLVLHAFYYSLRGPRWRERPPDVGPNSLWWPCYPEISRYIATMCRLNTGEPDAGIAVLCESGSVPVETVKPLYERSVGFSYLDTSFFEDGSVAVRQGCLCIARMRYEVLLVEDRDLLRRPAIRAAAEALVEQGGVVCTFRGGYTSFETPQAMGRHAAGLHEAGLVLRKPCEGLYTRALFFGGRRYVLAFNLGPGALWAALDGRKAYELWLPFENVRYRVRTGFSLAYRQSGVLAETEDTGADEMVPKLKKSMDLTACWERRTPPDHAFWDVCEENMPPPDHLYTCSVWMETPLDDARLVLEDVRETALLCVNGVRAGYSLLPRCAFTVGAMAAGETTFTLLVWGNLANKYNMADLPTGLIGASRLEYEKV